VRVRICFYLEKAHGKKKEGGVFFLPGKNRGKGDLLEKGKNRAFWIILT